MMKEKEYNYEYSGFKIIIRNGQGRARLNAEVCFDIIGRSHEDMKCELERRVYEYRISELELITCKVDIEPLTLIGLSQIHNTFAEQLLHKMDAYSKKWSQGVNVRFGVTGVVSEGKSGSPNYQIETQDRSEKQTFYFNGDFYDADSFEEQNITPPLSKEHIKLIWHLKY